MKELNYLTDEELKQLMQTAENSRMYPAPDYLKNNILQKANQKTKPRQHELLFFGAKVICAAAAAIAMLFVAPDSRQINQLPQPGLLLGEETADYGRDDSFFQQFNQKTSRFFSIISDSTNSIFQKEEQ